MVFFFFFLVKLAKVLYFNCNQSVKIALSTVTSPWLVGGEVSSRGHFGDLAKEKMSWAYYTGLG